MLCGLGGLYIPLVSQSKWQADITAGKGWIVVALVIFVRWHPIKAIEELYFRRSFYHRTYDPAVPESRVEHFL
jgi:ABC-type uncharacterized transport system permease subunit